MQMNTIKFIIVISIISPSTVINYQVVNGQIDKECLTENDKGFCDMIFNQGKYNYTQKNDNQSNQTSKEFVDYIVCMHEGYNKGFCDSLCPNGEYLSCINNDRIRDKDFCEIYRMK